MCLRQYWSHLPVKTFIVESQYLTILTSIALAEEPSIVFWFLIFYSIAIIVHPKTTHSMKFSPSFRPSILTSPLSISMTIHLFDYTSLFLLDLNL